MTFRLAFALSFNDETILQCDDAFGITDDARVMGGKHKGHTSLFVETLHNVHDLFAVLGIEVGGRLVSQDELGVGSKRPGDCDALLLSAGELIGAVMGAVGESDCFQHFIDAFLAIRGFCAIQQERHLNIFIGCESGDERKELEYESDGILAQVCALVAIEMWSHPVH